VTDPGLNGTPVLVTGAGGFIGSHVVEALVAEGARVRALCHYNSRGSHGWLDHATPEVRDRIDVRLGDIGDAGFVDQCCAGVEVVVHLAALIAIPYSYLAPESFLETNVRGTLNVLQAAQRQSVRRVVHTSTSEVYGTPASLPIRESHALQAQSPYAASKAAADQFALAFHQSFGTPVVVLRPFNTYGPRQSTRAVLPTILAQLLKGERRVRLGRLDPTRDLTYVTDTAAGFLRAATAKGVEGRVLQLGTGRAVSMGELFAAACKVLGVDAVVEEDPRRLRPDASEVLALQSDYSAAHDALGWSPAVGLEEGLQKTAAWFREHFHHYESRLWHV
jgi:NAD dependent epimerase/dehydratase